jgi:hypothetical protein
MPDVVRIPITNVFADGGYTGRIFVGPQKLPMNVLLDTGSSALALSGHKYHPKIAHGDVATKYAQSEGYDDGSSWTGAVINTSVSIGEDVHKATVPNANVGIAYNETANMFGKTDGILGLAYAELNDAYVMPENTWPKKYTRNQITHYKTTTIQPYMAQLTGTGVVSDITSFYTLRSAVHKGAGGAADPLNQGWMVVGGGKDCTDLYTGKFQTAKILTDQWYNTYLKAIKVGDSNPIHVPKLGSLGNPSNSIVDSGTPSLDIGPHLLATILERFPGKQRKLLHESITTDNLISASDLDLSDWPDLTFILQGEAVDVTLKVSPSDYWQINSPRAGAAAAAITRGEEGFTILGLPLMNGYFTIFDGEADKGRGVIRFASSKR